MFEAMRYDTLSGVKTTPWFKNKQGCKMNLTAGETRLTANNSVHFTQLPFAGTHGLHHPQWED